MVVVMVVAVASSCLYLQYIIVHVTYSKKFSRRRKLVPNIWIVLHPTPTRSHTCCIWSSASKSHHRCLKGTMKTKNGHWNRNQDMAHTLHQTILYNHADPCYEKFRTQMVPGSRTRHQKIYASQAQQETHTPSRPQSVRVTKVWVPVKIGYTPKIDILMRRLMITQWIWGIIFSSKPRFEKWVACKIWPIPTAVLKRLQMRQLLPKKKFISSRPISIPRPENPAMRCRSLRPSKGSGMVQKQFHDFPLPWSREPQEDPRTWDLTGGSRRAFFGFLGGRSWCNSSPNVAFSSETLYMKLLLKLQQAPQILQPNGRICHLGNRNVLLHVLHALHILHILLVEAHHALHDLEVPSLLADKARTIRAYCCCCCCCIYMAYGKMPVERHKEKDTKRTKDLSPEYSAVLGSHVSHARSSVWTWAVLFWTSRQAAPAGGS